MQMWAKSLLLLLGLLAAWVKGSQDCPDDCIQIERIRERIEYRCLCGDEAEIDKLAERASLVSGENTNQEFIQPSSDLYRDNYQNEGGVKVHKVNHVEHHSNQDKLRTVQSHAKKLSDKIATTRILESPALPAAHRQDKKSSAMVETTSMADIYFLAVVAGCSVAGLIGLVVAGVCWYKLQKNVKAASEAEYPAYGVTGPTKERLGSPGDRKLAQSAQMYHYQHQKQQMIALEKANGEMKHDGSDEDSEEENEEGDYTVYECPGLAPTGEMEVKNPLFSEETPVTPTPGDEHPPEHK